MSRGSPECVLFAGPSLPPALPVTAGVAIARPAGRGDIARLVARRRPGVLALADGVFHQTLAVGHAELRDAVTAGWQVWGLSSLGAIRACEMRYLGMRGYGTVYRRFVADPDFSDDEVALLHSPDPPYRPVSEPMIHLRIGLDALVDRGLLTGVRRRALVARLSKQWYGDRTLGEVKAWLLDAQPESASTIERWVREFPRFRAKVLDVERFLTERPWRLQS